MPNWVRNNVTIKGKKEDVDAFVALVKTKESDFDFDAIVPMPKTLNMCSSNLSEEAIVAYITDNCQKPCTPAIEEEIRNKYNITNMFSENWAAEIYRRTKNRLAEDGEDKKYSWSPGGTNEEPMLTLKEAGQIYATNMCIYGAKTWYDWCVKYWGTKWSASEASMCREDDKLVSIYFDTAWSAPVPIYEKLTELFPKLNMVIEYADEDIGNNCGRLTWSEKRGYEEWYPKGRGASTRFANKVWGY